jgi:hypothetical protein
MFRACASSRRDTSCPAGLQGGYRDFQARELALHHGLVAVVGKQELMEIAVLRGDRHLRAFDQTMR